MRNSYRTPAGTLARSAPVSRPGRREPATGALFPLGPDWEITPARAWSWFEHRFDSLLHDPRFLRGLGPLDSRELLLLVWDLECYESLCERYLRGAGPRPLPLDEYLRPGREQWGLIGRLAREDMEREDQDRAARSARKEDRNAR